MPRFIDETGKNQNVTLNSDIFRAADDANQTVRQYINTEYPTTSEKETFVQMCESEGLFFKAEDTMGINSASLRDILDPPVKQGATTTRENPVQSRLLFPPALMSVMEDTMAKDRNSPTAAFDQMVGITTTIASNRSIRPILSYGGNSGPEDFRAQQISQLSLPPNMLTITASEQEKKIPTFSVGLAVADEVMEYTSLDLVALALARQKEVEMFSLAGEALMDMINGDVDNGQSALAQVKADTLDALVVAAGSVSHLAYMEWLHTDNLTRRMDYVIVDSLKTAMAVEGRAGKPVITSDDPNSERIDTLFQVYYPNILKNLKMFIAPTEWAMTANTIAGLQSNSAIMKTINSKANYESTERWALRKGSAMRFDFGQTYHRIFDDAWSVLSLTLTP